MKKRIFILGIFSLFINISFLASEDISKYKLIFLGDATVGKSCILNRFMNDTFTEEYQATIGLDYQAKNVQIDNQNIYLLLYDYSGQERFRSLIPMYTRDANIILLVYDVTSKVSFLHLSGWFKDLTNVKKEEVIFAVVGNKTDLNDGRKVSAEEGKKFADKHNFIFAEVSAKTGEGIQDLFEKQIYPSIKKKFNFDGEKNIENLENNKIEEKTENLGFNNKIEKKTETKDIIYYNTKEKTGNFSCASCLRKCFFCCC